MAPCYVIDFTVGWSFGEPQVVPCFLHAEAVAAGSEHVSFRFVAGRF
jgi:hypothetical protein